MTFGAIPSLALASLWNRRGSALLTILAVAVSVMLFLGVDKLRTSAEESFTNTLSGTQLIVGARTSEVSLVLFSVFHIGNPTAAMTWQSYEWLKEQKGVNWTVPIALGDSHRGYRVVGTTTDMFEHYKFRNNQSLSFSAGGPFNDLYDIVIGAKVAEETGYELGTEITLTHGLGEVSFVGHDNRPFRVVGIMNRTGTPIDQSVLVSLNAIEAIHVGWESGSPSAMARIMTADDVRKMDLTPDAISATLVGMDLASVFGTQRAINTYSREALIAAIPGQAISEVWKLIGVAGKALMAVSGFVILVGLVSILTSILTSLRERRREMAVLRSIGASPGHIVLLLLSEAVFLAAIGALLGIALVYVSTLITAPLIENRFGIALTAGLPGQLDLMVFICVTFAAGLLGLIPALQALKNSLADGLSIKL